MFVYNWFLDIHIKIKSRFGRNRKKGYNAGMLVKKSESKYLCP